jgi:Ca2+-binding EF-hand superfamily protein
MKLKSVISNNQLNISQIFTNFDQDKNGILDYNEFSKLVKCIDATVNVENIRSLFGFFDLNKDGKILFDEFQRALR